MAEDPDLQVLDVRERSEWDAGHLPGSVLTPWHDIHEIPEGIDGGRRIAVICAGGMRSATAASLLKLHGAMDVIHVVDGGVSRLAAKGVVLASNHAPASEVPA
jgi:rhodanese-related sulfurtransferase